MKSRPRITGQLLALLIAATGLSACSGTEAATDAGTDASTDGGPDSGTGGVAGSGGMGGTAATGGTGGAAGTDAGVSEWRIFVTETVQNANFGGLDGADQLCATQASEAALEGEFKAWLSTSSVSVLDRLTHADGPYVLVEGTRIANDWSDLVDRSILAPINRDANGDLRTGDTWTGTMATGASYLLDDCAGFTSGSAGIALCGQSGATNSTWTQNITPGCSTLLRLYCIEQ
jgi:hypothetical protein